MHSTVYNTIWLGQEKSEHWEIQIQLTYWEKNTGKFRRKQSFTRGNSPKLSLCDTTWKFRRQKQKQPTRGVLQQIYRRTPMPKCDFNKVALQLYWKHTSAWVFSCKFDAYFQIRAPFFKSTSEGLLLQKPRPMEILHDFFLITPGNFTSFLIDPWNFYMLFL